MRLLFTGRHIVGFVLVAVAAAILADVVHLVASRPHSLVTYWLLRPWLRILVIQLGVGIVSGSVYLYAVRGTKRSHLVAGSAVLAVAIALRWLAWTPALANEVLPGLWVK